MCSGQVVVIFLIVVLLLFLLFNSRKSNFQFNNADYQYHNPDFPIEKGYYECLFKECGGNTNDFVCLEKCKFNQFHGIGVSDVRDRMCDYLPVSKRWGCLNNLYKKYGYNTYPKDFII